MGLFMMLTHLDLVATKLRRRVVVVINPMSDDETAFASYLEAAAGAVSAVVHMRAFDSAEMTSRASNNRNYSRIILTKHTVLDGVRPFVRPDESASVRMDGGVDKTGTVVYGTSREK
jgi:hypothetical protein